MAYAEKQRNFDWLPKENMEDLCQRLGLASSVGTPRRAAVLAFHKSPSDYIPSALIRTIVRTTSHEYPREEIKGPLSDQIEQTIKWMTSNLRTISKNVGAGQRVDRCEIPEQVLRALVVNAIVHRDYEAKECVRVEITPRADDYYQSWHTKISDTGE